MKAKLVKIDYQFFLYNSEDDLIATTEESPYQRLSMKNCQAIEHGYDLDEMAEETYPICNLGLNSTTSLHTLHQKSFKEGFQKALEILGDKKFSEDDMERAFEIGEDFGSLPFSSYTTSKRLNKKEFIQSLQKTEWDVEIEMEFVEEEQTGTHLVWGRTTPKLDSDGCLILKLKSE